MRNFGLKAMHSLCFPSTLQNMNMMKCVSRAFTITRPICQLQSCSNFTHRSSELQTRFCGCFTRSYYNVSYKGSGLYPLSTIHKYYTTSSDPTAEKPEPKPSLYQRFKAMYRDYWYVLIPVHLVTSAGWFGGFYYMASSGVDIVAMLEWMNVSDRVVAPFRNGHSKTGYLAISYALYKIATPLRYTVTLGFASLVDVFIFSVCVAFLLFVGGTTVSINYLRRWGYIKPVPSKEKLKEIYADKKEQIIEKGQTLKGNMMQSLKPTESKKKNP